MVLACCLPFPAAVLAVGYFAFSATCAEPALTSQRAWNLATGILRQSKLRCSIGQQGHNKSSKGQSTKVQKFFPKTPRKVRFSFSFPKGVGSDDCLVDGHPRQEDL